MKRLKQRTSEIEICESISLVLCPNYSIIEIKFIQKWRKLRFGIAFVLVLEYNRIIKTRSEKLWTI